MINSKNDNILKTKAVQFKKFIGGDNMVRASDRKVFRWKI